MPRHNAERTLAAPTSIAPRGKSGHSLQVIIETPKGSRNKYAYDPRLRAFQLKKVLPAGIEFPYDFGFVPATLGGDGDPLDVLVLMDEAAFTGCVIEVRTIGVIEATQRAKSGTRRNDRLIAVEVNNHAWATVKRLSDLGEEFVAELEEFFISYHRLDGETYKILHAGNRGAAARCLKQGLKRAKRRGAQGG
jgi:inorganic pyrophosphatase